MNKPSIIFMGTPEFSVPALERIHAEFGVKAVVTVPDKPSGRGQKITSSAVKIKAQELGLPVLQPEKLKDPEFVDGLKGYNPDIIVVIAFRILPEDVYSLAKLGSFNIHGSLLPRYRGAAPINWTIIKGDKVTGLTSFILKKEVDTGDVLLRKEIPIPENATAGDLHDLMMPHAADLSVKTIELLLGGKYTGLPQDASLASPAPKIFPEQCKIDWSNDAYTVKNFIHGMSPIPGAWTIWNGKRFKIYRATLNSGKTSEAGTYKISDNSFDVYCTNGSLSILEMQLEGKKTMKIRDFLAGYRGDKEGKFE
jgi:methionyl-tRNA formyltransferase